MTRKIDGVKNYELLSWQLGMIFVAGFARIWRRLVMRLKSCDISYVSNRRRGRIRQNSETIGDASEVLRHQLQLAIVVVAGFARIRRRLVMRLKSCDISYS